MKSQNLAKPWGPAKDFFTCSGYHTHNMEGYVPKPESLTAPSRPPPAERTAKDQPFFYVPRNPDISPGSDAAEQEVLSRKKAAAASNALSMAKYIYNNPGMPELDLVSGCNFSWREAHNKMLMCCFIALDNLKKKITSDRRRPRNWLFFSPVSYSSRVYVERGKSFNYSDRRGGYSRKSSGRGRGQGRSVITATVIKPGQSTEGQTTTTVSVPQDSNKRSCGAAQ